MHVSVRNSLLAAFLSAAPAFCLPAHAGTQGVYLPPAPSGPGGEDSIETSSGTRCRQSLNSNGAYVDFGVMGSAASPSEGNRVGYSDTRDREGMAYARITLPLGKRPERIDCTRVYDLEIEKLKREVEMLRLGLR